MLHSKPSPTTANWSIPLSYGTPFSSFFCPFMFVLEQSDLSEQSPPPPPPPHTHQLFPIKINRYNPYPQNVGVHTHCSSQLEGSSACMSGQEHQLQNRFLQTTNLCILQYAYQSKLIMGNNLVVERTQHQTPKSFLLLDYLSVTSFIFLLV